MAEKTSVKVYRPHIPSPARRRVNRLGRGGLQAVIIAFFTIFAAFPFYWMLIATFKTNQDLYRPINNPFIFNQSPTLDNLKLLFNETNYAVWIGNSIFIGIAVVLITLLLAVPAAYALARLSGRLGEQLGILMFMVYLIPPTLLFIPMSRVITLLGLRDSIWSLILVYPTFTVPFCTWLLMGFMKSIPADIEEQATVDGYTRFGGVVRVIMPLALPGLLTVVVFSFTLTMHEFIYALAFVSVSAQKVISIGVTSELIRGDVYFWQSIMSAGIIVAIPVALIYNIFLNRFVAGFTLGAVKG
ncbi:MAG: carbohydrate ABC transporter permease [Chloroflexi bacterium]|nr:carbohydrate ABC transporter permease [Chloroflexota bacterium]